MNRLSLAAIAGTLLLTATTAFAADVQALPTGNAMGQKCEQLYGVQRKVCMGATISSSFEKKMDRKMQRRNSKMTRKSETKEGTTIVRGNHREIYMKEVERQRKFRLEQAAKKDKEMKEWMKKQSSSSSAMSSSSSSAMSSSSSSAMSSSSSSK
jgi:hypothetical protein